MNFNINNISEINQNQNKINISNFQSLKDNSNIIKNTSGFINPIFLCFCHLKKFVNYFKHNQEINNLTDKSSLTYLFKNILDKIWPLNNQYNQNNENIITKYSSDINKTINNMTTLFKDKNNSTQPFDLVNFIIMTLHKELNKNNQNTSVIINSNFNSNQDQTNELVIWNNFLQKFQYENKSLISDIFYGTLHNKMQCPNCNVIKHNFEIFQFLIFGLENIKQFKINNILNMNLQSNNQQMLLNLECLNNLNSITIYDCFDFSNRMQTLNADNAIPCDKCGYTFSTYYRSVLYTPPEILILILDRSQKSTIKIEFLENLDLSNYIVHGKNLGYMFNLIGVVSQEGENGCYVAYCRNFDNNQWYRYDDKLVSRVTNFKNQIVDSGVVNILFYQKINN